MRWFQGLGVLFALRGRIQSEASLPSPYYLVSCVDLGLVPGPTSTGDTVSNSPQYFVLHWVPEAFQSAKKGNGMPRQLQNHKIKKLDITAYLMSSQ